jgi:hypothetical protein
LARQLAVDGKRGPQLQVVFAKPGDLGLQFEDVVGQGLPLERVTACSGSLWIGLGFGLCFGHGFLLRFVSG